MTLHRFGVIQKIANFAIFSTITTSYPMKRILLLLSICIITLSVSAARYRVGQSVATVWDADNPSVELGRMNPGNTFTSQEVEDSKVYLEFKGKRGYIAAYLCEEIPESTAVTTPDAEPYIENTIPQGSSANQNINFDSDIIFNYLCFFWFFAGVIMAFFLFFDREKCLNYFNRTAGAKVANMISLKCFRPFGFIFFMGLGLKFNNIWFGLSLACIYEAILLAFRAKHFNSWRASIVEALYLLLWSGGAIIIVSGAIIMMLLGSQSSPNRGKKPVDKCCYNCRFGSRNNGSTCDCRYHGIEVDMNSCCNHFTSD